MILFFKYFYFYFISVSHLSTPNSPIKLVSIIIHICRIYSFFLSSLSPPSSIMFHFYYILIPFMFFLFFSIIPSIEHSSFHLLSYSFSSSHPLIFIFLLITNTNLLFLFHHPSHNFDKNRNHSTRLIHLSKENK